MFTGIIQSIQKVTKLLQIKNTIRFAIDYPEAIAIGNSVSLNGVCLTVVAYDHEGLWFEAISETLERSNLKTLKVGSQLHCERAARFGEEIGGHILSGHIACEIPLEKIEENRFSFLVPKRWRKYLFEKGYVALDGVSLTIVSMDQETGSLCVHLITETLKRTLFDQKNIGETANLEIDSLTQATVESVERILAIN